MNTLFVTSLFIIAVGEAVAKLLRPILGSRLLAFVQRIKRNQLRRRTKPIWLRLGNYLLLGDPSRSPANAIAERTFSIGRNLRFPRAVPFRAVVEPEWAAFSALVQPGSTALDVGASIGTTALALAELVGSAGKVFAFEPVPENIDLLRQTFTRNNLLQCVLIDKAVWRTHGERQRIVWSPASYVHGTMFELDERLRLKRAHDRYSAETYVETVSLQSFIAERSLHVDLLKIDVQGAENAVLEGLGDAAASVASIYLELHITIGEDGVVKAYDFCRDAGYDVYVFDNRGFTHRLDSPIALISALFSPSGPSGVTVIASRAEGAQELFSPPLVG